MGFDPISGAYYPDAGGLSLADLYTPSPVPQMPALPPNIMDFGQLPGDEQKKARRASLLRLAALLGNAKPGMIGSALAQSAADTTSIQDETVKSYRDELLKRYQLERVGSEDTLRQQEAQAQNAALQRRAQANLDAYGQLQKTPAAGAAGFAARVGDEGELAKLLGQAPTMSWMRSHGYDPNDPTALEQAQHKAIGPIDLANAAARQRTVGDIENQQRLGYLGAAGSIEARNAGMRVAAETPGLVDRAQQMYEAGMGADFRSSQRIDAGIGKAYAPVLRNIGGKTYAIKRNHDGSVSVSDLNLPSTDPFMKMAEQEARAHERQFNETNPGMPYDVTAETRKILDALHKEFDPKVKTPAPQVKGSSDPPSSRLDDPNGAPTGPPGTAGRPGVGDSPGQTLGSYLQGLPAAKRARIQPLVAQRQAAKVPDSVILQEMLAAEANVAEQRRRQAAAIMSAAGQGSPYGY